MLKSARTFTRLGEGAGAASAMGIDSCPVIANKVGGTGNGIGVGDNGSTTASGNNGSFDTYATVPQVNGNHEIEDDLFMGLDGLGGMGGLEGIDGLDFGLIGNSQTGGVGKQGSGSGLAQGWAPYI